MTKASLDQYMENILAHLQTCDRVPVTCKDCKETFYRKDFREHLNRETGFCQKSFQIQVKCDLCSKDYTKDFELLHFNKECTKSIECSKCNHKFSPKE